MKKVLAALVLGMGLLALGAGCKDDKGGGGDAKSGDSKAADSKSGGGDSVGVPECDDYIKKYEGCIKKAGGAAAAAAETAFKAQRDGFKQSASTPEGKAALKGTCKQMLDSLATNPMCK
jgi:hypothetical protein